MRRVAHNLLSLDGLDLIGPLVNTLGCTFAFVPIVGIPTETGPDAPFHAMRILTGHGQLHGFARLYFPYLAYIAVAVAIVSSVVVLLSRTRQRLARDAGAVAALLCAGATLVATMQTAAGGDAVHRVQVGLYVAVVGFVLVALGCLCGTANPFRPRGGADVVSRGQSADDAMTHIC